ncbi:tryptorubin family RiPP precursor [Streptomyces soliscabiei]|nr:tryptorubin family RiPP precursor [Streptomyces sp. NY05-11A]MDX2682762.1 tryptorubin family RiPP precursor [Streptomyces sp. NY05-11A]
MLWRYSMTMFGALKRKIVGEKSLKAYAWYLWY